MGHPRPRVLQKALGCPCDCRNVGMYIVQTVVSLVGMHEAKEGHTYIHAMVVLNSE